MKRHLGQNEHKILHTLIPQIRVLPKMIMVTQPVKKLTEGPLPCSQGPTTDTPPPVSDGLGIIPHLRLGPSSDSLHSGFPAKMLH